MRRFLAAAAVAVLTLSAQAQADTRAQCVAACGDALSSSCGWITKPGRFIHCRAMLYKQCKRWGVAAICSSSLLPPPPPPPPPPPTTTTTLPPLVIYPNLLGSYFLTGTVTGDICNTYGIGTPLLLRFTVTEQSGTALTGTMGPYLQAAQGTLNSDNTWSFSTPPFYDFDGCKTVTGIKVGNVTMPTGGDSITVFNCGNGPCGVEVVGTVSGS
jgi:hypothetical protein